VRYEARKFQRKLFGPSITFGVGRVIGSLLNLLEYNCAVNFVVCSIYAAGIKDKLAL